MAWWTDAAAVGGKALDKFGHKKGGAGGGPVESGLTDASYGDVIFGGITPPTKPDAADFGGGVSFDNPVLIAFGAVTLLIVTLAVVKR